MERMKNYEVSSEQDFSEKYKPLIRELFDVLGHADIWSEDLTDAHLLEFMRSAWIGQEHGYAADKIQYPEDLLEGALSLMDRMSLTGGVWPKSGGQFDYTVALGATEPAMVRRADFAYELYRGGVGLGHEFYLVGERPRIDRDGTDEDLLLPGKFGSNDIHTNPWVQHRVVPAMEGADIHPITEFDLARLVLSKMLDGDMAPYRIDLPIASIDGRSTGEGVKLENSDMPPREHLDAHFVVQGRDMTLINGRAVDRGGDRVPRPTTESTIREWLERYPPKQDAKVLVVTSNPHGLRQLETFKRILAEYGREDVGFELAAAPPPATMDRKALAYNGLGEVARMIEQDNRRQIKEA